MMSFKKEMGARFRQQEKVPEPESVQVPEPVPVQESVPVQVEPLDLSLPRREVVPFIADDRFGFQDNSNKPKNEEKSNKKGDRVVQISTWDEDLYFVCLYELALLLFVSNKYRVNLVIKDPSITNNPQTPKAVAAAVNGAFGPGIRIRNSRKRELPLDLSTKSAKRQRSQEDPVISYPAPKGTEHPYNGILYQVPQTKGQGARWLINWTAPNWTEGPTVVGRSCLNDDVCLKKHDALRRDYMQWLKTYRDPMKCALEIEFIRNVAVGVGVDADPNASLLYRLFMDRFWANEDQVLVKQWPDFHLWHLFCYKRYLLAREGDRFMRPNGDCKNYGHRALFAICSIVGAKGSVSEFAIHTNEIE